MLKVIYVFFLGLILTIAVGIGVAAFYPEPEAPTYPSSLDTPAQVNGVNTEQQAAQKEYDQKVKEHSDDLSTYNRNVSMIVLGLAVIFLILSMMLHSKAEVVADGMLLGGILTLLYSIIRGFGADDDRYTFMLVLAGVIIALILGYLKFVKSQAKPTKSKTIKRKK